MYKIRIIMSLTSDKISLINRNIYSFDSIIVPLTFLTTQPPKVTLNEVLNLLIELILSIFFPRTG